MATAQQKVAFLLCLVFASFDILHTAVVTGAITGIEKQNLRMYPHLLEGLKLAVLLENEREPKPPFKFVYLPYTLEASKQVVQGMLYRASVTLAPSKCKNDVSETREDFETCGVDFLSPEVLQQQKSCQFEIRWRPWLPVQDRLVIEKAECKPSSAAGGKQP